MMVPQFSFWLLLVTIIHCLVFPTTVNAELAFVRPNTSVACAGSQQPCLTFNEYAQQVNQYFVDNTTFLFLPGTHVLDIRLNLEGLSNISLIPLMDEINSDTVQLLLSPSVNITWTNCENVELRGLGFILSGEFSVPSAAVDLFSAELVFHHTSALLANLTLIGNGTRLFAFTRVSSDLQISNLMAKGIRAPTLYASDSIIIFYGQNNFFNNSINVTVLAYSSPSLGGGSLIQLNNGATCHIRGNISFTQNTIYVVSNSDSPPFDVYGGTAILINHRATLVISGIASFVRNRATALHGSILNPDIIIADMSGGAIYAISQGRVIFEESSNISFTENSATSEGGAVYIYDSYLTMYGRVLFEGNSAGYDGGAIAVVGEVVLAMNNCSERSIIFRNNTSQSGGGGAISSANSNITLWDILFERNTAVYGGAIYAQGIDNSISVELRDILFERNTALLAGGAVHAVSTLIDMTGTLDFVQNSAQRGGAIAFRSLNTFGSLSKLVLTEPLMANFVENSANMTGGVIFFDDSIFPVSQSCAMFPDKFDCFIDFSSRDNIRLNFDNNSAEIAGKIFYGGHLDTCTPMVSGLAKDRDQALNIIAGISNVNVNVSNYNDNTTSNVSSDPLRVCICKDDSLVCNRYNADIKTVRGKEFTLKAVIVGQGKRTSPSAVRVSLDNGVQISSDQHIQPTGNGCTNISYRLFAESNATELTLFPDNGPCRDFGIGHTQFRVTFLPCPNGFNQTGSECVCEERLQRFNAICNVDDGSIEWTASVFWMGVVYDDNIFKGLILYPDCPFDFCLDTPVPITLDNLDIQCNHNHVGTLCGSCREGYSIALGTLHCLPCSNDYLALILLFAVTGIALVAILLLLRLTVTAGTINGLIFYANIVQANNSFFFPAGETNILTVFIAWLNLDLGIETCFYDGMTTYAYTWLQFVFPFYVWFLIGLIIVMSHYSSKLTKIFGHNPVAALTTLFLLSYSKLLRTIIASLSVAMLDYPDDKYISVWFYDGKVSYGSGGHIVLVIFAILVLVCLFIPYTLLLFFAHWLQALSHLRILSWLNKIKPFMDTYHAPYKKQTRYWTGLLLFVRLVLAGTITNESILVVIISLMVALTSLAWMQKGIYENYFNNILEAFFIANLSIFAATMYTNRTNVGDNQDVIAYLFVGLAFAAFVLIVLFHAYLVLSETAIWKKIPKPNIKKYFLSKKEENKDLPPGDDRGRSSILQAPTQTSVDLREPLLDQ